MASRSILLSLGALFALGVVAFFAFFRPVDVSEGPSTRAARTAPDAQGSPHDLLPRDDVGVADDPADEAQDEPRPAATTPAAAADESEQAPAAPGPSAPAPSRARRPETVRMPVVSWHRAAANDVVREILRETGLRLDASAEAQDVLDRARVTLNLENKSAAYVLGMVLLPHSLGFTVRDDRIIIFVEDD